MVDVEVRHIGAWSPTRRTPTRGVSVIGVTTSIEWQQIQGIACGCRLTTPHRAMLNMESKFADISDELWDRVQRP